MALLRQAAPLGCRANSQRLTESYNAASCCTTFSSTVAKAKITESRCYKCGGVTVIRHQSCAVVSRLTVCVWRRCNIKVFCAPSLRHVKSKKKSFRGSEGCACRRGRIQRNRKRCNQYCSPQEERHKPLLQ